MQNDKSKRKNNTARRRRAAASKGQVDSLAQQVEHQALEISNLTRRRNVRVPRPSSRLDYGTSARDAKSTIRRKMGSYDRLWNNYLNGLLDPFDVVDQSIPDLLMFPYTTVQVRTVAEITVSSSGTFLMYFTPDSLDSGYIYNGVAGAQANNASATVNSVVYGIGQTAGSIFPNTLNSSFDQTISGFRLVSMGVRAQYIGPMLTASGRIASACLPKQKFAATAAETNDYSSLANYNYSYTGRAPEGCTQIWLPGGPESFQIIDISDDYPFGDTPVLCIAADGLPVSADKVMTIELVQNYEVFTINQLLTAHKSRIASSVKMEHASSTLSAINVSKGLGHSGASKASHKPWWKTALEIGKDVAEVMAPIASVLLAA